MPYIGIGPNFGNLSTQAGTGDGFDVTPIATLDYTVATSASIGVYLDGVRQVAGTDYVANGTTLTFTTAPPNLVKIEVVFFGLSVDIGTPGLNTVDSGQLVNGSVDIVHFSATGTPSASVVLKGDNSWGTIEGSEITTVGTTFSNYSTISGNTTITTSSTKNMFLMGEITVADTYTWTIAGNGVLQII
jgi:hypothetical protein